MKSSFLFLSIAFLQIFISIGCGDRAATRDSKERKPGDGIPLSQRKPVNKNPTGKLESLKILDLETVQKFSSLLGQTSESEWVNDRLVSTKDLLEKPQEYENVLRCFIHLRNLSLAKDLKLNGPIWEMGSTTEHTEVRPTLFIRYGFQDRGHYFILNCSKKDKAPTLKEVIESLKSLIEIQEIKNPNQT